MVVPSGAVAEIVRRNLDTISLTMSNEIESYSVKIDSLQN